MQLLLAHPNPELQFRGAYIIKNLCRAGEELAHKVVLSPLFEVLLALTTASDEQLEAIAQEFYARLQLPDESTPEAVSAGAADETSRALTQATAAPAASLQLENAHPIAPVEEVDEEYVSEFPDEDPSASSSSKDDAAASASAASASCSSAASASGAVAASAADEKPAITIDEPSAAEPQTETSDSRVPDATAASDAQRAEAMEVPALDPTRKAALRARARQCVQEALETARGFRLLDNQ